MALSGNVDDETRIKYHIGPGLDFVIPIVNYWFSANIRCHFIDSDLQS